MKFQSKNQNLTVVVIPARKAITGPQGTMAPEVVGLRAKFRGGQFDSEGAQMEYRWTDEQRLHVERYLMEHKDFNTQGGFWLLDATGRQLPVEKAPEPLTDGCKFVVRTSEGAQPCDKQATVGPYCAEHAEVAGYQPQVEELTV